MSSFLRRDKKGNSFLIGEWVNAICWSADESCVNNASKVQGCTWLNRRHLKIFSIGVCKESLGIIGDAI